jgi:hypothetical protein
MPTKKHYLNLFGYKKQNNTTPKKGDVVIKKPHFQTKHPYSFNVNSYFFLLTIN